MKIMLFLLDAIASPSTYPLQSVSELVSGSVIDSFRLLCELVLKLVGIFIWTELIPPPPPSMKRIFQLLEIT